MRCDCCDNPEDDEKIEYHKNANPVHPIDDEEMQPDAVVAPLPPPPPEAPDGDLDGNWERPQRHRARALPKPAVPTKDERAAPINALTVRGLVQALRQVQGPQSPA